MFKWLRKRKVERLEVKLAGLNAQLEGMDCYQRVGGRGLPGWWVEDRLHLIRDIAKIETRLGQLKAA